MFVLCTFHMYVLISTINIKIYKNDTSLQGKKLQSNIKVLCL